MKFYTAYVETSNGGFIVPLPVVDFSLLKEFAKKSPYNTKRNCLPHQINIYAKIKAPYVKEEIVEQCVPYTYAEVYGTLRDLLSGRATVRIVTKKSEIEHIRAASPLELMRRFAVYNTCCLTLLHV